MPFYGIYHRHGCPQFLEDDTLEDVSKRLSYIEDEGYGFPDCIITDQGIAHLIYHKILDNDVSIEDIKAVVKRLEIPVDIKTLSLAEPIILD
jgi:hypothetical protein